eukprot:GSMAST32.ASY1.ANO1.1595.1 assembled CDS
MSFGSPAPRVNNKAKTPASTLASRYTSRLNAGKVAFTYNKQIPVAQSTANEVSLSTQMVNANVSVKVLRGLTKEQPRYMYTSMSQRAQVMEDRLLGMRKTLKQQYLLGEITPVGVPSQTVVTVVGRVCCEPPAGMTENERERLDVKGLMLEGSREHSRGARVRLNLKRIAAFSLFPGQVVAIQGINASGSEMTVHRIYHGCPRSAAATPLEEIRRFQSNRAGKPLSIWAASGPFTLSSDLNYLPLFVPNKKIENIFPKYILQGPFVDLNHPMVKSGRLRIPDLEKKQTGSTAMKDVTYDQLFTEQVILKMLVEMSHLDLKSKIVLVPSIQDAHHTPVFPQPAFSSRFFTDELGSDFTNNGQIMSVPNPSTLKIGDVTMTKYFFTILGSHDIIGHQLGRDCYRWAAQAAAKNAKRPKKPMILAANCINQRSMYPIFPPKQGFPLDLALLRHATLPCSPDILLLRSQLNFFADAMPSAATGGANTIAVNAGTLCRKCAPGTYARIVIQPLKLEDKDNQTESEAKTHQISSRTRVEIVRI